MPYRLNSITGELDLVLDVTSGGGITQIDTDSGSVIPVAGIVNLLGDATQGVSTSGSGNTGIITIADATESQNGVVELATDAESIAGTANTNLAIIPSSLAAKLGSQTQFGLSIGNTTSGAFNWTSAATDGQIVIGATGANPDFASLTSTGGTITITPGPNILNIDTAGTVATSYQTDSGTAFPSFGMLEVNGEVQAATGIPLTTTGLGNTVKSIAQVSSAQAASDISNAGMSSFDSTQFSVDANGFVTATEAISSYIGPFIVGTDPRSDYDTIQAAIDAVVAAGASASFPLNIYIKPGLWDEDLVFPSGFFGSLIALNYQAYPSSYNPGTQQPRAVYILGNHEIQGTGYISFFGCTVNSSSGNLFHLTTATNNSPKLYFYDCSVQVASSASNALIYNDSTNAVSPSVRLYRSFFQPSVLTLFGTNPTSFGLTLATDECYWGLSQSFTMPTLATSSFNLQSKNDFISGFPPIDASNASAINMTFRDSVVISNDIVTIGASTGGETFFKNCTITSTTGTIIDASANSSYRIAADGVLFGSQILFSDGNDTLTGGTQNITNSTVQSSTFSKERFLVLGNSFLASSQYKSQASVQTTDATETDILNFNFSYPTSFIIKGTILGTKTDFTECCGGDFMVVVQTVAGGAAVIGTPIFNVESTSTATFDYALGGGIYTFRITVTGVAAEDWDWVCTYEYQYNNGA